jgi:hypothetical protein
VKTLTNELKSSPSVVGSLTDSTINIYISNIKNLFSLVKGEPASKMKSLSFLKDSNKVLGSIGEKALTTQRNYLATILKFTSIPKYKKTYKKAYEEYTAHFKQIKDGIDETAGKKTEKQKDNWSSFNELKEVQQKFMEDVKKWYGKPEITLKQYNELLNLLIVSLYTETAPRRAEDYYKMKVVNKTKEATSQEHNYYVRKEKKFIFRSFKTAKTHGEEQTTVPESLINVINMFEKYKPESDCLIVKMNGSCFELQPDFSRAVSLAFGKYIKDKKISINLIRNIYATEKYGGDKKEKEETAKAMGTSVAMLNSVYTKTD